MLKYRVVGIISILIGLGYLIRSVMFAFGAGLTRSLSQTAEAHYSIFSASSLGLGLFFLLVSFANLFVGFKLFSKDEQTTRSYLKWGLISIFMSTIGVGLIAVIAFKLFFAPTLNQIYNQSTSF